jgi:uncharacterized repeat protein (TIGR04138 family)
MLCEKCGQRETTIHLIQSTSPDGITFKKSLCEECGKDEVPKFEKIAESQSAEWSTAIELILAKDLRYTAEAYEFALEAMHNAFSEWHSEHSAEFGNLSPVTENDTELADMAMPSKQLVVALQRLASERFGKCATATFNLWGITCWQDFAEIVSRMQKANVSLFWLLAFNREDFKGRGVLDDVFPER